MKLDFDCVVIGSGVAGMTAALYLKRADVNCLIVEKEAPGGLINKTSIIENYPGCFKITGPDLALDMYQQLIDYKIPFKFTEALEIIDKNNYKIIKTPKEEISCKGIILALGRIPRKLGIPNEDKLIGKGIGYCAICDGPLYKNKEVMVIGGGNSAIEESIYLADLCKKVTIIHRKDQLTADKYLIDKINTKKNVKILYNTEVIEFLEKNNILNGAIIKNNQTNKQKKLKLDGCFIFIGYVPATKMLDNLDILDENKSIITDENMKTSINNIYACGDVRKKDVFQIVTATSDGAIAATSFIRDNY